MSESSEKSLPVLPAALANAARNGLMAFACTVDQNYDPQWFHRIIAAKLEDVMRRVEKGESPRVMIHMPPRHGKSDLATQKFPAWVLGHHPEWPFIVTSYAQDLATTFGLGTRDIMNTPNYRAVFKTRLREDTKAKSSWKTAVPRLNGITDRRIHGLKLVPAGGGYESAGVGGPITGKGFKVGIIDDPFKNFEEADSPVIRENVWQWWKSTFYTRQEGNAAIIIINTRWHEDDLNGRLVREEEAARDDGEENFDQWEILNFPALAEIEEKNRKKGDPLWPEKFNAIKLEKIRRTVGPYLWNAMYQQQPYSVDTQEFRADWYKYRLWDDVQKLYVRKFATIDTALGKKRHRRMSEEEASNTPDYTGVARNYVDTGGNWNLKVRRYEINSKGLVDLIFTLHDEGFEKIGIEEGAYKEATEPFFKEECNRRGIYPNVVTLKHNQVMKETRIRGTIPMYANGMVYHIVGECEDLEGEQRRFPHSKHDDCMDAVAYMPQIVEKPVLENVSDDGGAYAHQNFG